MAIDDRIRDEKMQYDINREAAKLSALSSGKIDKYEYLTSEEILPSDQGRVIEQAKFTYSPLGKALEKQRKTIEEQGKKTVEVLDVLKPNTQKLTIKDVIPENALSEEAKNELNKIKGIEKTVNRENLVHRTNEYTNSFKNFRTINTFGRDIYNGTITLKEANKDERSLLVENMRKNPQNPEKKKQKKDILKNLYALLNGRKKVLDAFERGIFLMELKVQVFQTYLRKLRSLTIQILKY